MMKWILAAFALVWGAVIASFIHNLWTIETSISPGVLANVAYSPIAIVFVLLSILAFLAWLIPVLLCRWLLRRWDKPKQPR